MYINFSKVIFYSCLILGTIISISSNSWLGAWMGLEINLLSFIPLMSNINNILSNESSLKYFLVQALASSILLFSVILNFFNSSSMFMLEINNLNQILINSSLLLKMGAAPFHFWFPSVMENLNWSNCLILMTWQKIAPLVLISYSLNFNLILMTIIISLIIGAIGGFNQTNLRSLMAFSSINHLGWILSSMLINENLWMTYFIFYSFLSIIIVYSFNSFQIYHINQLYSSVDFNLILKFFLLISLLSLGGLPPFLGFLPKLLVIQTLSLNNYFFLLFILVMTTLITLFFYIRVTYTAFMLMYPSLKWNMTEINNKFYITLILNSISLFGLILMSFIYSFY
uniref:NADH-ubiquinone oxidoreductase chain 2 n=1 Tax=Neohermes inexpectatus TaxID=2028656 RepID=A0A8K1WC01_9NEOP|nr:NADH dehydrogenase subunit 2 [Neohermes inexpectatus]